METTTENVRADLTPPSGMPSDGIGNVEPTAPADIALRLIVEAIALVGEEGFVELVEGVGQENLRTACARLMGSGWWEDTLKSAILVPQQYNTQLINKMLDKAVPTKQAARAGMEEGFKLLIEVKEVKGDDA